MPLLEAEVELSKTELANIVVAFSVVCALGQIFGGSLADRFDTRLVVTLALAAAMCALLARPYARRGV